MSRPRGYAQWGPREETLLVLANVQDVLREYRDHLPLTARQIFYRLVGQYGYDKTERAYARLCEYLVRARRSRMIPFSAIRDDGTVSQGGGGYDSAASFWDGERAVARGYRRDRQQGQPNRIELWCEAAGMVPQLARVAAPYSIPVYSTGGFSSVTVTHEIAQRAISTWKHEDRPTVFLHVGDFDPSGESIFDAMSEDAETFAMQELARENGGLLDRYRAGEVRPFSPERVALTEDQVVEHSLPTAPPKKSDTRSRNWVGDTCQLEAMPPDLLAKTVENAIGRHLDADAYDQLLDVEREERDEIVRVVEEYAP